MATFQALDSWLVTLRAGGTLSEGDVKLLCDKVRFAFFRRWRGFNIVWVCVPGGALYSAGFFCQLGGFWRLLSSLMPRCALVHCGVEGGTVGPHLLVAFTPDYICPSFRSICLLQIYNRNRCWQGSCLLPHFTAS